LIVGRIESPYVTHYVIPKPNEPHVDVKELIESFEFEEFSKLTLKKLRKQ
jgi:hypothetical protein